MKKILLSLLCVSSVSAFASVGDTKSANGCTIWTFGTDTKSKSFTFSYYDNQNDKVMDGKYWFNKYEPNGLDFAGNYNCSTEKYNGFLTYAFKNSTCKDPVDSSTLAHLHNGDTRRYECNDNTSLHAYKLSDNAIEMYLEPKDYTTFLIDGSDKNNSDKFEFSIGANTRVVTSPDFNKHCQLSEGFYRCDGGIPVNTKILIKNNLDSEVDVSFWVEDKQGIHKKIGVCGFQAKDNGQVSVGCNQHFSDARDYKIDKIGLNWLDIHNN